MTHEQLVEEEVNYETRDYDGIKWIRYDHYEHALTTTAQRVREETIEEVRQTLRELRLLDYYCKCDDIGHVVAMSRTDYDKLLSTLNK